jgi:non-ribosomal peptide synthetase component F
VGKVLSLAAATAVQQLDCLLPLVLGQASKHPDAIAVRTKKRRVTYGELNDLVNKFAGSMRRVGVERGALEGRCSLFGFGSHFTSRTIGLHA